MKLFIIILFLLMTINYSCAVEDSNLTSLTQKEIIDFTLENNPVIKASKEKITGFEAYKEGSGKWTNPELIIGPNIGDSKDSIILSQTFDITGKFSLKRTRAEQELLYTEAQFKEICLNITLDVNLKYYDYCKAVEHLKLQQKNIEIYKKAVEKAEIQYNLGDIPQADLLRLQLEEAKVEQALIHAENQMNMSRSALFSVMGLEDNGSEIKVISRDENLPIVELNIKELTEKAVIDRPLVDGQKALIASKEYGVKIARSDRYPDLIVSYWRETWEQESPQAAEFRLAFPLWDYGSIGAQTEVAEASQREEEANLNAIKSQVKLEVENSFYEYRETSYLLKAFREKILMNSDELLTKAQYGYEEGIFSYIQFLDAMRIYNDIQSEYIEAFYNYLGAISKCERVTGSQVNSLINR